MLCGQLGQRIVQEASLVSNAPGRRAGTTYAAKETYVHAEGPNDAIPPPELGAPESSEDGDSLDSRIEAADGALRRMASKMLRDYPSVRRWEQTDDVWNTAAIKFLRALSESPPSSKRHFFRLAAIQIRRVLIDWARKYNGPEGLNSRIETAARRPESLDDHSVTTNNPVTLAEWTEFHRHVEELPEPLREVFDLVWYVQLDQNEAAQMLGIGVRTLRRRWRQARLEVSRRQEGRAPV